MSYFKHFDETKLYECPKCNKETLTIHEHGEAECSNCSFKRRVNRHRCKDTNVEELHIEVDGETFKFKPKRLKDLVEDDKVCVVENNELICVAKESLDK